MSLAATAGRNDMQTYTLETPDVDLVYDVVGPLPTADGPFELPYVVRRRSPTAR
jgi:hypothetical protein